MTDDLKRKPKMRHCANCGAEIGVFADWQWDRHDTCGSRDTERAARDDARAEREEAHERLDRDMGY